MATLCRSKIKYDVSAVGFDVLNYNDVDVSFGGMAGMCLVLFEFGTLLA